MYFWVLNFVGLASIIRQFKENTLTPLLLQILDLPSLRSIGWQILNYHASGSSCRVSLCYSLEIRLGPSVLVVMLSSSQLLSTYFFCNQERHRAEFCGVGMSVFNLWLLDMTQLRLMQVCLQVSEFRLIYILFL